MGAIGGPRKLLGQTTAHIWFWFKVLSGSPPLLFANIHYTHAHLETQRSHRGNLRPQEADEPHYGAHEVLVFCAVWLLECCEQAVQDALR
jgi:hypothetical protein